MATNTTQPGVLHVALAGAQATSGNKQTLEMSFRLKAPTGQPVPLIFTSSQANEGLLNTVAVNGQLALRVVYLPLAMR